jgi:alpha-L-fucosidase
MSQISRRNYLKLLGAGAAVGASGSSVIALPEMSAVAQQPAPPAESAAVMADRERRMKWWHEAKFGMFIVSVR